MTDTTERGKILDFSQGPSFYAKRGDARRAQNDLVSAISMYNKALEQDPSDLDTRIAAAQILTDMSRFNDSNRMLVPYMHEDEEFEKEAWCMVGFNLMGLSEFDGSRRCFDRFFSMTDEVSARTDAVLDAIDFLESSTVSEPYLADADAIYRTRREANAQKAFDSGDFERAAKLWEELAAEFPGESRLLYDTALACICSHREGDGKKHIERLLELEPENVHALCLKLLYAKNEGDDAEKERLVEKLEASSAETPEELVRINGVLIEIGRYGSALRFAQKLAKLMPYDTLANHRLGVCLIKLGQYQKAADVYDRLLKIDASDEVAAFYRGACSEERAGELSGPPMIQYQLPFERIIGKAKGLLDSKEISVEGLRDKWNNDPDFRSTVRWAFTLHEFNISNAMINLLRAIGGESAERVIREAMADIDANRQTVNEAMGALKRMDAPEPYFAMLDGCLVEGRVNMVDMSGIGIPKAYREIFPRMRDTSGEFYGGEVLNAAATIVERFIAGTGGKFKQLSEAQSVALSAAVEYIACDKCDRLVHDGVLERYGITERRLMNAIDRLLNALLENEDPFGGEDE
jgi:tetratricopeptide (TPR) repeat protein